MMWNFVKSALTAPAPVFGMVWVSIYGYLFLLLFLIFMCAQQFRFYEADRMRYSNEFLYCWKHCEACSELPDVCDGMLFHEKKTATKSETFKKLDFWPSRLFSMKVILVRATQWESERHINKKKSSNKIQTEGEKKMFARKLPHKLKLFFTLI